MQRGRGRARADPEKWGEGDTVRVTGCRLFKGNMSPDHSTVWHHKMVHISGFLTSWVGNSIISNESNSLKCAFKN